MKEIARLPLATPYMVATAISILGWWLHFGTTLTPWFIYDDSYITLGNAIAFAGGSSSFSGPALTGSTSIGHVLFVAALTTVVAPELALALSNFLGAVLYISGLIVLAQSLELSRVISILAGFLGSTIAYTSLHLYNGLETGLAMSGVIWSLIFLTKNRTTQLAILCGVLPWLRPELVVWSGLAMLMALGTEPQAGSLSVGIRKVFVPFLLAAMPFLAICWVNTGFPIPQTMSAKQLFFAEDCAPMEWKNGVVLQSLSAWAGSLGIASIGFAYMVLTSIGRASLLFICVFLTSYFLKFPGALGHYDFRYLHLLIPFVLFAFLQVVVRLGAYTRGGQISLMVIFSVSAMILNLPYAHGRAAEGQDFSRAYLRPVADWINANTPESAMVLVHDAGYAGFAMRRRLVDLVGLKSPEIIGFHSRTTHATCGRNRVGAILEIIKATKPDYMILLNRWDDIFRISHGLVDHGLLASLVLENKAGYSIYRLDRPSSIVPAFQEVATPPPFGD